MSALRAYPATAPRRQPAGVAVRDRAAQGDRYGPRPGASPARALDGVRTGCGALAQPASPPTTACGPPCGSCPPSSARRWCIGSCFDLAYREDRGADGDQRRGRSPECQRRPAPAARGGGPMTDLEQRLPDPSTPSWIPRLTAALARRADAARLLDVAYASIDSPLGPIAVFVTPRGLLRVAYDNENFGDVARRGRRAGVAPHPASPRATDPAAADRRVLRRAAPRFDLPIDWSLVRGFAQGVLRATAEVPFGETRPTGTWRAPPAHRGPHAPRGMPSPATRSRSWCRATASSTPMARIGGYTGGLDRKRILLRLEGVSPPREH